MRAGRLAFVLLLTSSSVSAQTQGKQSHQYSLEDYVSTAREFLRSVYPSGNGRDFRLTLETTIPYDEVVPIRTLHIDIGYGPKEAVLGYSGGCRGPIYGEKPGQTSSPGVSPSSEVVSIDGAAGQSQDCPPVGPIHPEQFVDTEFQFDPQGHCIAFRADGPGIGKTKALKKYAGELLNHPEWGSAELLTALTSAGAQYGPSESANFVKHLPMVGLEKLLGKLELLSVTPLSLEEYRRRASTMPDVLDWTVRMRATRSNGTRVAYELTFDQFSGDLTSISLGTL